MASESTSSQQSSQLSPSSKVNFKCEDGIIAFNNAVALLEHTNVLYHPMLRFLSNCSIGTALTIKLFAIYVEYIREFWYTVEVDDATKTITFSLSSFENPISFTQDEFISTIGLPVCRNVILGSHDQLNLNKQTIAYRLIWGLEVDIGAIIVSDLVYKLQNRKKIREPNICYTRFLSLIFEKLLGENYMNNSLTFVKPHTITAASFQKPFASEVALTSHMLKLVKLSQQPKHSLIFSSEKVNADDDADKSLSETIVQLVTQPKAPTDLKIKKKQIPPSSKRKYSYKSLDASKSAEEQVNQHKTAEAKKPRQLDDDAQIMFMGVEPSYFKYDQSKSTMHGDSDSGSGLRSMPDDNLASLTGFETPDSFDDESKEGTTETFNAFADMPALSDTIGHLNEELRIVNTKIDQLESSVTKKVTDDIQSFMPSIVEDSLKENLPESIEEKLPVCAAQVQQSLQDQLLNILLKPINKEFNAFNTLESHWFVTLQQELSKVIKTKLGLSVRHKVRGANTSSRTSPLVNEENALVLHTSVVKASKENNLEKKVLDDEPPVKKLKFLITTPSSIPSPTPLKELTLPRDQNPPRDESKGKGIATEEPLKEIIPFMEEGGSVPKIPSFKSFVILEGELTNEDVMAQLKEMKRLSDLKAEKEKSEKSLQKIMNPATIRA
ncbi:hypothetical protein Tco_1337706 [Tanacetum coccineum]